MQFIPAICLASIAVAFVTAATPTNTSSVDTDVVLRDAREAYALTLKNSMEETMSGIAQATTRQKHAVLTDWNATIDTDIGGLENLSEIMREELASLLLGIAQQEGEFLGDILETVFRSQRLLNMSYEYSIVRNCGKYAAVLKHHALRLLDAAGTSGVAMEVGSGLGFGFQLYCGCDLLLSSGGGFGSGFTANYDANNFAVEGGLGGGGGTQLFSAQLKSDQPILNLGGGGGGHLEGCLGASDQAQLNGNATMDEVYTALIAAQMSACPAEALSLVGGGGGGVGFTLTNASGTAETMAAYGGGLDLKLMSSNAVANDRKCGGLLLQERGNTSHSYTQWNYGNYTAIDTATRGCRQKCEAKQEGEEVSKLMKVKKKGLNAYWKCACQCTRNAFQKMNMSFASSMQCP